MNEKGVTLYNKNRVDEPISSDNHNIFIVFSI